MIINFYEKNISELQFDYRKGFKITQLFYMEDLKIKIKKMFTE